MRVLRFVTALRFVAALVFVMVFAPLVVPGGSTPVAHAAGTAVGSDEEVCFENADRAAVHLVADHLVTLDAAAVVLGGPTRVLDTRD